MRTATFDSINASQLVTATDRVLACGGCSKRRGPHVSRRYEPVIEERTVLVTPLPVDARRSFARRLVALAVLVLVSGAVVGIRASQAASTGVTHSW
jgi:hypothetical protein